MLNWTKTQLCSYVHVLHDIKCILYFFSYLIYNVEFHDDFEVGSNIYQQNRPVAYYYFPYHMRERSTKIKLGEVGVGSNTAQNYSSSLQEVISDHYRPKFTYKI